MFQPLGTKLNLHAPTGHLQLSAKKSMVLNSGLAKLLGVFYETDSSPALAHLGNVEGFNRSGEEDQLYAFQLSDKVYKRKNVIKRRLGR